MHIHFIIHADFELPGAYERWAQNKGHTMAYSRLYDGETLPENVNDMDMLIVMGGPQSPLTSLTECPYFDSLAEQNLIIAAKDAGKVVIGVCLGAQMIGQALGGMVEHSPEKEIGSFPIFLTEQGLNNSFVSHFGTELTVGHWHGDMPGLTAEAVVLAYSAGCPRQIITYAPLVYGFQCHLEFTHDLVETLIAHAYVNSDLINPNPYIQSKTELRAQDYAEMNGKLYAFLDKISQHYLSLNP